MKKIITLIIILSLVLSQVIISFGYNYNKILSNISLWNNAIYVDSNGIYYIKTSGGGIYKSDLNGNNEVLLAGGYVDYFSGDNTYLYYRDGSNSLSKMKKDGSNVELVKSSVNPVNIKVDNSYIFYIAGNNDELHRIDKNGTNDILLYSGVGNYNIAGNYVYFVDKDVGDTIYRVDKNNTNLITIKNINLSNQYWHINNLSIDNNDIFYEEYNQVFKYNIITDTITQISSRGCNSSMLSGDYIYCRDISNGRGINMIDKNGNHIMFLSDITSNLIGVVNGNMYFSSDADGIDSLYKSIIPVSNGDSNGNYSHYILNRLTATEGNMQYINNSASVTNFSNGFTSKI